MHLEKSYLSPKFSCLKWQVSTLNWFFNLTVGIYSKEDNVFLPKIVLGYLQLSNADWLELKQAREKKGQCSESLHSISESYRTFSIESWDHTAFYITVNSWEVTFLPNCLYQRGIHTRANAEDYCSQPVVLLNPILLLLCSLTFKFYFLLSGWVSVCQLWPHRGLL